MIAKFQDFDLINENLNKARAVLRQAGVNQDDPRFVKLRQLLNNNLGYIGKFTEWMILNKVEYNQLESLFNRIKDQSLSKPIDQFNTPEESPKDNLEAIRNIVSFNVEGKPILGLISKGYLAKLLHIQDERIQLAAAYQMIPQELKDLFDFTLNPKSKKENAKTEAKKKK